MATYIVIEISENDNALEIMNLLMTQTKARFTITKEIGEYAAEREQLKRAKTGESSSTNPETSTPRNSGETSEPPRKKSCPSQPPSGNEEQGKEKDIRNKYLPQTVSTNSFANIVPKLEEPEVAFDELIGAGPGWHGIQPTHPYDSPVQYSSISEMIKTSQTETVPNSAIKTPNKRQNDAFTCQMCGALIKAYHLDYYKRSNHAIIHTNLQRYLCPVDSCGTKTRHRSNMVVHARTAHGLKGKVDVKNCLLPHEDDELKQTVINCFPEMEATIRSMQERERKKLQEYMQELENGMIVESDDEP